MRDHFRKKVNFIPTTLMMGIKYVINAHLFLHLTTSIMRDIVTITRNVLKTAKKTSVYILETELPQGTFIILKHKYIIGYVNIESGKL